MSIVSCLECGKPIFEREERCPDCGTPNPAIARKQYDNVLTTPHTTSTEYKAMLAMGIGVAIVGVLALLVNSLLAAILAIGIGLGTTLSAALGIWRNARGQ